MSTLGLLGKALSVLLATREVIARANPAMGVFESIGILGVYKDLTREKLCNEAPLSLLGVTSMSKDFERDPYGMGPETLGMEEQKEPMATLMMSYFAELCGASGKDSPTAKELKLVFEVSRITGLSCDGQEGKLMDVLGKIIAKKHRKGVKGSRVISNLSFLAGYVGGSNLRVRANRNLNEA